MNYSKEELDELKERDYIAWSELTGDPVTGMHYDDNDGCGCVIAVVVIGIIIYGLQLL